jgi:hypothetical protein
MKLAFASAANPHDAYDASMQFYEFRALDFRGQPITDTPVWGVWADSIDEVYAAADRSRCFATYGGMHPKIEIRASDPERATLFFGMREHTSVARPAPADRFNW